MENIITRLSKLDILERHSRDHQQHSSMEIIDGTVYQCIKPDTRYIPAHMVVVHEADSQLDAIEWLENNGGGVYRNLLHNFDMTVNPKQEK